MNQLSWLIWSYKSYMFVSLFYANARTKEKLIKVIVKYFKMLPYLKSDGILSPCGSFPFLAVVHRVCGTLHGSSLYDEELCSSCANCYTSCVSFIPNVSLYLRTSQVAIECFPVGVSPTKYTNVYTSSF